MITWPTSHWMKPARIQGVMYICFRYGSVNMKWQIESDVHLSDLFVAENIHVMYSSLLNQQLSTVFPRIIAGGKYFLFRTDPNHHTHTLCPGKITPHLTSLKSLRLDWKLIRLKRTTYKLIKTRNAGNNISLKCHSSLRLTPQRAARRMTSQTSNKKYSLMQTTSSAACNQL